MHSSMKVLSVKGTAFLPTLVCPLFRMSSRTDFKFGYLSWQNNTTLESPFHRNWNKALDTGK